MKADAIGRALWDHQKTAVTKALENLAADKPYYGFFMEQGTGKTLTMITLMRELYTRHGRPLKTLILCPAIVVRNWQSEISQFSRVGHLVEVLTGPTPKRIKTLERTTKPIIVTNLEALATCDGLLWESVQKGKGRPIRRMIERGWELLILDEIHRLKDPRAQSTKMAIKMADKIFYRYGLTGTPILKDECDLWSQMRVLDRGALFGKGYQAFRTEYFYDENAGMPSQRYFPAFKLRPQMSKVLGEKLETTTFRVTKEECLDLPPLIEQKITVEMSPQQRKHYDEMKRDFITYLASAACVATLAVTKALRLQQIVSGFVKLDTGEEIQLDARPRLNALSELLELAPGKVIVWASFKENYEQVAALCRKLGLSHSFLTGLQSQEEKDQAVADFTKGDVRVLISNPAAGGTGVNLIEADTAIWWSRSFNLGHRLQAQARNHRGGSEMHAKITQYDIVAENTIDEHVLDALARKEDIAERILSWRERV
jgi:SNF2 family DNA or RNA helicase